MRRRNGVVGHRVLTLQEVLVVLGVILRDLDMVSGERSDLVEVGPPAQRDQLTATVAEITREQLRARIAGRAAVATHPGSLHDVDVFGESLGAHQASPHPRDHGAAWNVQETTRTPLLSVGVARCWPRMFSPGVKSWSSASPTPADTGFRSV